MTLSPLALEVLLDAKSTDPFRCFLTSGKKRRCYEYFEGSVLLPIGGRFEPLCYVECTPDLWVAATDTGLDHLDVRDHAAQCRGGPSHFIAYS